jgi:hypothetical protein
VKRLPGPLRLRAAIDRQWQPGLWLLSDHHAAAAEKPRSRMPADSASVVPADFRQRRNRIRLTLGLVGVAPRVVVAAAGCAVQRSTSRTNQLSG